MESCDCKLKSSRCKGKGCDCNLWAGDCKLRGCDCDLTKRDRFFAARRLFRPIRAMNDAPSLHDATTDDDTAQHALLMTAKSGCVRGG